MVFTILGECFSYAHATNTRECECTIGRYGSYYGGDIEIWRDGKE